MRMWMLNPKYMCNRHIVGEYAELFKHRHNFVKHHSMKGRTMPGNVQIEPSNMRSRYLELREEMLNRGMHPKAKYIMPDISYLPPEQKYAKVSLEQSFIDLASRCPACSARMMGVENVQLEMSGV